MDHSVKYISYFGQLPNRLKNTALNNTLLILFVESFTKIIKYCIYSLVTCSLGSRIQLCWFLVTDE